MPFHAFKPIRYIGPLPPLKVRKSSRKAVAEAKPEPFVEIRGVHVYTYADRVVVSNGIYSTYRYRDRLAAGGGRWDGSAWTLPAGTDVEAILAPPPKQQPTWICCSEAKVLSHKTKHYSCQKHTMYWEDCMGSDGQPIKILYAISTRGGGCYTGN